ncbi:MAG: glycosyltransferase family 39 protein [Acidobacteriia bacterium]|nr:glycosyltransferase family 39 protein [Terriglobia bacterium]
MGDPAVRSSRFLSDTAILVYLAVTTWLLHMVFATHYGIFRDELYYIACSKHLAWGYVDEPPFAPLLLFLVRHTLGESLYAIRFLPAVCNSLVVLLSGLMARELGAGRFGQALAGLAVMVGGVFLGVGHFYSMSCFDHLFWALAVYVLIRLLKEDRPRLWLLFGLIAGVGLMNKYSMGFLGIGLIVGLLLTPARRYFRSRWLWIGGALASLMFLPHVLWEYHHGFPTAEFIHNATFHKNLPMSPPQFMMEVALELLPLTIPLWLAGIYFYFFSREGKPYRVLGWIFLAFLAILLSTNAKPYYFVPAFPMLFAGGAVLFEAAARRPGWGWSKPGYAALLALGGIFFLPYAVPVLPVDTFIKYENFVGIHPSSGERDRPTELPQVYADQFGWENQVAVVAKVYNSLTPEERARTLIYCSNYGQAGAIDFFGKKYGLPNASSGHNNYWFWGPQNPNADMVITIGEGREDVQKSFNDVQLAATVISPYARSFETNLPIYIGRGLKMPLKEIWPHTKDFI